MVVWKDNHHGHNDAEIVPLDITQWPAQGKGSVKPPHYTTSPYSGAPYTTPYCNGRIFLRGADGIYAYEIRNR